MQQGPDIGEKNNKLKVFLIICIVILLGLNAFLGYLYITNTREIKDKKKQIKFTTQQLVDAKSKVDSLEFEIQKRIEAFEELQMENDSLMGTISSIDSLKQMLANVQALKNQFKRDATKAWFMYNEQKDQLDGFKELLNLKDRQIAGLKEQNTILFKENRALKVEKVEIVKSIDTLKFQKAELEEKVKLASTLEATNMQVKYIDSKKREKDKQPFKAKKISRLKIEFNLPVNKVATVETKRFYLRIVDPEGKIMMDESSGKRVVTSDNKVFTAAKDVLYRRDNQQVSFYFSKGGDYPSGEYKVEIHCEGVEIGNSLFEVK